MADKPLTLGAWKVRRFRIKGTGPGEADSFGWSIFQPDGTERARFTAPDFMAEHFAMALEYTDRLRAELAVADEQLKVATDRAQRFRDALLRVAARIDSWSYQDVWACVADALGVTVIELGQQPGE